MKSITMSGESEESRIMWPKPSHCRREKPYIRSEMDRVAHYITAFKTDFFLQKRAELEDGAAPQVESGGDFTTRVRESKKN